MRKHPAWFDTRRLGFRLYALLGAAVALLVVLSLAGSHIAHRTLSVNAYLVRDSLRLVALAPEVRELLERHETLVMAAPFVLEPGSRPNPAALIPDAQIQDVEIAIALSAALVADGDNLRRVLLGLFLRADTIRTASDAGDLDGTRRAATAYQTTAAAVRDAIRLIHAESVATAGNLAQSVATETRSFMLWSIAALMVALVIIAPIGLLVLGDASRRLRDLWRTMRRITSSDISVPVPSVLDADEIGEMARAVQVLKDNALALARHRSEVEQINGWLDIALNNMARGISMFDAEQKLVLCNDMYRLMYDLPEALSQRGTPAADILAHRRGSLGRVEYDEPDTTPGATVTTGADRPSRQLVAPVNGEDSRAPLDRFIAGGQMFSIYQYLDDGRIIALANKRLGDGSWVAVHEDVTRHRQAEAQIAAQALTDALTGLANRRAFRDDLDRRCAASGGPSDFAVMLVDLDGFKPVNDTYGHLVGDALLVEVAHRLQGLVRTCDHVARVGGDEFAVIEAKVVTADQATALASRIVAAMTKPFVIDDQQIAISACVGIALAPDHGMTPHDLLTRADLALYHAKENGRGRYTMFETVLEAEADVRRALEADLRTALDQGELELHYQPIVDAATAKIVAFEALLRWRHPSRGLVPPMAFIPFAEQSGLIVPIGAWALKQACRDAATWPPHISVSVNLSAVQVQVGGIVETVAMALAETGLIARRLELEVTETLQLGEKPSAREQLLKLRSLGVRIALDDFGTGYASLSYLRRFPFDKLKIDRMFIADIADNASLAIVEAITAMARSLDMITVAEGVETGEHLNRARAAGCAQLQGYLFSKPVPAGDVMALVTRTDESCEKAA